MVLLVIIHSKRDFSDISIYQVISWLFDHPFARHADRLHPGIFLHQMTPKKSEQQSTQLHTCGEHEIQAL